MMIPKNSRSRRKQLSPHDSNDGTNKAENTKALPTITRTSNHSSDHYSNSISRSNSQHGPQHGSNDSQCSWVELDFDQTQPGKGGSSSSKSKGGKPISSVNVRQYLVDDEENSSTTSNLSEDFTDKGEVPRGNEIDDDYDDDDDDDSVTSFGSDSFAADVNFDDLLEESLRPSKSDLGVNMNASMQDEALDEILEMGDSNAAPPTSYRSSATKPGSESTKPESERSKASGSKRQSRKLVSPKSSKPKKKVSGKSKSPGVVQARKRISDLTANTVDEEPPVSNTNKEHKSKKVGKKSPGAVQGRKRLSSNSDNAEKKVSPKSKSPSAPRRRRLRSADGAEEMAEDESKEAITALKDGSSSKTERVRTKSKSKHRKTPGRTRSSKNEDILRNSSSKEGDQATGGATPSRELRKRYKKKALGHESDGDEQPLSPKNNNVDANATATADANTPHNTEPLDGTTKQGRSKDRDGKKKIRSKSTDEKKIQRHSDGRRRRKKKPSKSFSMGDEPPPSPLPDETNPPPPPETVPPVSDVEEDEEVEEKDEQDQQQPEAEQPDVETMEKMTYSFHFRSEDEDENDEKSDKWLNSANSSSSSLSYNSFAQFSLDVGEMSGLVTDLNSLMESGLTMTNSPGFVPDLDASCQSVMSNHSGNLDASVVFMSGKSSKGSLLASHSFDTDDNDWENDKSRSARSMPVGTSEGIRPEKQLRRRLKKSSNGGASKSMVNSEIKKKVRRARSGGLEKLKDSMIAGEATGKRSVGRTKSHNESLVPGSSKLVVSSAKRQERQEKSSRRKKEKQTSSAAGGTNKPKHAGKSKSAHVRELSASPRNKLQTAHSDHLAMFQDDAANGEIAYNEKNIPLNDVDSSYRSPRRSPKERAVRRTYSNPCPSPSIHAVTDFAENSISPMSYDGGSKKNSRRSSPSRQALLSNDEDSDQDSDSCYSPHSNKKRSFLPKRGLQRTPSSLLAGVRNHFKENTGAGKNMLSQMKRTFSVSGRGKDVFSSEFEDINIGMTTERGYVGATERRRRMVDSANRKSQIKNSLYACMDDDDSSIEISSEIFEDGDSDDSGRGKRNGPSSVASFNPKGGSDPDGKGAPRRVNSLPIGARRNPH